MKVLVIGSGGREHTLCWKIAKSPLVDEVFCAPGNGGILEDATCIDIAPTDIKSIISFVKDNHIELSVVGPEAPLVDGIADAFSKEHLKIFGPDRMAAALEGSKSFAKILMKKNNIPTASFEIFGDPDEAKAFVHDALFPVVIKADGLAAGKGVIVTSHKEEAYGAIDKIMVQRAFDSAGDKVVVEKRLTGEEASFIAITDGKDILPMASSQDHKRAYDNDEGPNTGGMGAYSPAPMVDTEVYDKVMDKVLYPLITGLRKRGIIYRGFIYAGLMITGKTPYVLEFNVRMGDPEAQPLLMRLKDDIVPIMVEVAGGGSIKNMSFKWDSSPSVCVVMASKGYPGHYEKGKTISGIDAAERIQGVKVFHAGTKRHSDSIVTSGGRVLGVTALGRDIKDAIEKAYKAASRISFDGAFYRKDIGKKFARGGRGNL
ncbi:MAG: phosphoribosylamine--glycine ligase [Deltaproteobacteria bacterium]|nr:phosphoribosylamine--glycine ligase [Deltaproteobacteria bacterium]